MSLSLAGHVSEDVWCDFVENRAPAATAKKIQAHLNTGCEKCTQEWESWKRFLGVLDRSRTVVPAASVLQRASALFDTLPPRPSFLERLVANLVFDSRQNALPALARASTGSGFNLVYTAKDANIHLWCEYDGLHWQLTGQVLPAEDFWSVAAVNGDQEVKSAPDETGEFRLSNLTPGRHDLILRGTSHEVVIPILQLGE